MKEDKEYIIKAASGSGIIRGFLCFFVFVINIGLI